MSEQQSIVFVIPTATVGQLGPVAGWLNAAGWATAAIDLGFIPTIFTREGKVDVDTLRRAASLPDLRAPATRRYVTALPASLKAAIKDAREFTRARTFSRLVAASPDPSQPVAFVWQRHELFHKAGWVLARRLRRPFVLYVPAPKVWEARQWGVHRPVWGHAVERFGEGSILRRADLVACVSEEVADSVSGLGVPTDRVIVTPSTADTTLFRPLNDQTSLRTELGLSDRFVIGWTGSFRSFHGLELLIEAMDTTRKEIPEALLMLIGDGPERPQIEATVQRRGLSPWVRFMGTVGQADLPAFLACCDIAVVLGRPDRGVHYSPLKLWEYLAMGRPVVASAIGSTTRKLTDGVNGALVPPGDVRSLVNRISKLRNDPRQRHAMGREARKLAERESWTHQLEKVLDRLDRIEPIHGG